MSHWIYIALAYSAFVVLLLWDFLMPHWSLKNAIRGIRLNQRKGKSA
jgi:Heme exporter protein D (CcmD)